MESEKQNCPEKMKVNPRNWFTFSHRIMSGFALNGSTTNDTDTGGVGKAFIDNPAGRRALYGIVGVLSILFNGALCIIIFRKKTMLRNSYNILVLVLAVVDTTTGRCSNKWIFTFLPSLTTCFSSTELQLTRRHERGGGGQSDPPLFTKVFNQLTWNLICVISVQNTSK